MLGVSKRTVQRLTSKSRQQYLQEQAERRERVRVYHDDEGHSWTETASHFGVHVDTVKRLAYRARKERAPRTLERGGNTPRINQQPPLF